MPWPAFPPEPKLDFVCPSPLPQLFSTRLLDKASIKSNKQREIRHKGRQSRATGNRSCAGKDGLGGRNFHELVSAEDESCKEELETAESFGDRVAPNPLLGRTAATAVGCSAVLEEPDETGKIFSM